MEEVGAESWGIFIFSSSVNDFRSDFINQSFEMRSDDISLEAGATFLSYISCGYNSRNDLAIIIDIFH